MSASPGLLSGERRGVIVARPTLLGMLGILILKGS